MDDPYCGKPFLMSFGKVGLNDRADVFRAKRVEIERISDLDLERLGKGVVQVVHVSLFSLCLILLILGYVLWRCHLQMILILKYDKSLLIHLPRRITQLNRKRLVVTLTLDL